MTISEAIADVVKPETRPPVFNPPNMTLRFDPDGDPKRPWVTVGDHSYRDGHIYVNIFDGFRTDFASYPRWLARVLILLWTTGFALDFFVPGFTWWDTISGGIGLLATLGLLLMDPFGRELRASVFHDASYAEAQDKFAADAMYRIIMRNDGVGWFRRSLNWWGVFLFGWVTWYLPKRREGEQDVRTK